jgi:hypothetical protein
MLDDNIRLVEVSISVATKCTPLVEDYYCDYVFNSILILPKPVTMVQWSVVDIEDKEFVKNGKKDINGEHFSVSLPCIFFFNDGSTIWLDQYFITSDNQHSAAQM